MNAWMKGGILVANTMDFMCWGVGCHYRVSSCDFILDKR